VFQLYGQKVLAQSEAMSARLSKCVKMAENMLTCLMKPEILNEKLYGNAYYQ